MAQTSDRLTARPPGRPRSERAARAIIDATIDLLAEEGGVAGVSIEAVAARAGVGKTTIYRRWPNKEALIIDALAETGINCWADKAYQGAGGTVRVPYRGRWENLSERQQAVNRSHARIRALVEQAVAALKSWRLLRRLRCSPARTTGLVQAALCLHLASSD